MHDRVAHHWIAGLLVVLAGASAVLGATPPQSPAARPAREAAEQYLESHREALGLRAADLAEAELQREVPSRHNGVTHLYYVQRLDGIEVVNGILNIAVDRRGRVVHVGDSFVPALAEKATPRTPAITREQAIAAAAAHLGLTDEAAPTLLEQASDAARSAVYAGGALSQDPIPVRLKYFPLDDSGVRLVWDLVIYPRRGDHWWNLFVDAESGDVLGKHDWVAQDTYDVIPLPFESPQQTPQTTATNPADPIASPFGWHDINGVAGADFTDTRGNNVEANTDLNADNSHTTGEGPRPDGGATLDFTGALFAFDDSLPPSGGTNRAAAVVNLFHWNNVLHDVFYHYGFNEAAGNFQTNNYGNGGLGSDPVQADAQDGSGTNNANFATPPDGVDPRMQMFIWTGPGEVVINSGGGGGGPHEAATAGFGAVLDFIGITDDVALVDDSTTSGGGGASTSDACCNTADGLCSQPVTIAGMTGMIAILDRGSCEFGVKVLNVQRAGAVGAIVVNNAAGAPIPMGPGVHGGSVTIPSLMLSDVNGATIKNNLPANVTLHAVGVDRDSDLDNTIIAHEYGHGISNRLTGGPAQSGCLQNAEQMGEGWSDFFAMALTHQAGDAGTDARGMSEYVAFSPLGIRVQPYSTDTAVNDLTYADIAGLAVPHGVGTVWATMLWDMYWKLVDRDGFDPDWYYGTGGNNLAMQLVVDGLKLQVCSPGFVNGRNAILAADVANNCGANRCLIWEAFAARGLGVSASQGSSASSTDGIEAFDLPAACAGDWIFNDSFESSDFCAWSTKEP